MPQPPCSHKVQANHGWLCPMSQSCLSPTAPLQPPTSSPRLKDQPPIEMSVFSFGLRPFKACTPSSALSPVSHACRHAQTHALTMLKSRAWRGQAGVANGTATKTSSRQEGQLVCILVRSRAGGS